MQLKKIVGLFLSTAGLACLVGCSPTTRFGGEVTREFVADGYSKVGYRIYEVVDNEYGAALVGIPDALDIDPYDVGDKARGVLAGKIVGKISTDEYIGHTYLNGKFVERAHGGYVHLIKEFDK
jgi:hypothetical protein